MRLLRRGRFMRAGMLRHALKEGGEVRTSYLQEYVENEKRKQYFENYPEKAIVDLPAPPAKKP